MNILFTICGRAGSKGLKSKNLLLFNSIPLPYYTIAIMEEYRQKYKNIHCCDIVSSTDSNELNTMISKVDQTIYCIDRIPELSGDSIRKIDVIRDAAVQSKEFFQHDYGMVVDLDITSPLRTLRDLESVIEKRLISEADVVYTVTESRRNPWFNMVMKHENGYYSTVNQGFFATRQQTPQVFDMNASIYAYSPGFILSLEALFKKSDIVIMRDTGFLDIDSQEDFEMMQVVAAYLFKNDPDFAELYSIAKRIQESIS